MAVDNNALGATPQEQLKTVKEAISSILIGGQSYKIGSRSLTRADLAQLRAMKKELEAECAANDNTEYFGDTYVGVFDGR
ncbi:MAG: peptidylprolyl isomerase [Lachnospiraceae bacterium]|jgi:hypothetical protein|nr:peptidylprolyl isomerase [Lachnospiraceae bacterium]